jgi:hypothetical protein
MANAALRLLDGERVEKVGTFVLFCVFDRLRSELSV